MLRLILVGLLSMSAWAQTVQVLSTGTTSSLRGITVIDAKTVWVSGDGGTVLRSTDSGATWNNVSPPGATELDFRDVEAFDANVAYAMASGPSTKSRIF